MVLVIMTVWALFVGMTARTRFQRSFGLWWLSAMGVQVAAFASYIALAANMRRASDLPPPILFMMLGAAASMALLFVWARRSPAPAPAAAAMKTEKELMRGWGPDDGALTRWFTRKPAAAVAVGDTTSAPGGDVAAAQPAQPSARGWGGEDGALKRWVGQAGAGVWIIAFLAMGFPGGTILMASVCVNRRLDGLDWVMSVIVPGFGVVKSLVCY